MVFKSTVEPYTSRIKTMLPLNTVANGDGVLTFSDELMYNIAKSTGLRSNKSRHIKKRFKYVMNQALKNLLEKYDVGKNLDSNGIPLNSPSE